MKPHLPLPLRRALLQGLSRSLRKTLCSGSLILTGGFLWNGGGAEAAASESGDSSSTAITLNGDVLQDETGTTASPLSTDRLGSKEEEADAEKDAAEAETLSANEAVFDLSETAEQKKAEPSKAELNKQEEEDAPEKEKELSFTERFVYGLEEMFSGKVVVGKGGGIEPWDPTIAYCHYRPRVIYVRMPLTPFLLLGGTYQECYGPWPSRDNTTAGTGTDKGNNTGNTDDTGNSGTTTTALALTSTSDSQTLAGSDDKNASTSTTHPATQTSTNSGSDNPSIRFAAKSMASMRYSRSMLAAASAYNTPALNNAGVSPIANANTLVWTGNSNGYWDAAAPNWTPYGGNGEATTFPVSGGAALFDLNGRNKDINITTEQNLSAMEVTAGGYSFSGGGNINITGELLIAARGSIWGATGDNLLVSFGQANNITAGSIRLGSGFDTVTTFGGSVTTTGALTIANGSGNNKGGSYIFNNGVRVGGAANITLGSDEGASAKEQLRVTGDFTAASLTLDGTARKIFNNAVTTTSGDLIISGHEGTADVLTDGITTFKGAVTIADGHKLVLKNNTEATFNSTLESAGGPGTLQIELNRGVLRVNTFISSMSSGVAYDLGTVSLAGQGGLVFGARTVAQADVIGNGQDLIIGGSAARADLYLTGGTESGRGLTGNVSVNGGKVTLFAAADSAGTLQGLLGGKLTAGNHATLTLGTNDLFATTAKGVLVEGGATLSLENTTQTVYGGISMKDGGIITGGAGSSLVIPGAVQNATFNYSGANNQLGSTIVQGDGNTLTFKSEETGSELALVGDIMGESTLAFSGEGCTSINTALSYAGNVTISDEATLTLNNTHALAQANKVTVGSGATLDVTHGGTTTFIGRENAGVWNEDVQMNVGLELESGAILTFSDLNGHGDTPAIALKGGLLFNGNVIFNFLESDPTRKLENLKTYELITSETGINHDPGSSGGVSVIANGKDTPLDESQYSFAYYRDDQNLRHLTFTLLVGKSWNGGASGSWHTKDANGDYANWTEGAVGDTALFRQQTVENVSISFDQTSAAAGLYMDGATNYTINGTLGTDKQAFSPVEGTTYFIKKGSGSMTWNALSATLSDVDIQQGCFALTGNTTVDVSGKVSVADATYDEAGNMANTALLRVDSSSALTQGEASLSGSSAGAAELRALTISDGVIAPNTSGTTGAATPSIKNAAISGYELSGIELQGTGNINGGTFGDGTTIASGATITLGGTIKVDTTVANSGTVTLASDVVLDLSKTAKELGASDTFTLFSGGRYTNWNANNLSTDHFRLNGVTLSDLKENGKGTLKVSVNSQGTVTFTEDGLTFVTWDEGWGITDEVIPIVAFNNKKKNSEAKDDVDVTTGNQGAWSYTYKNRIDSMPNNIYVANLTTGTGSGKTAYGDNGANGGGNSNEQKFVHVWLHGEGSKHTLMVAGADGNGKKMDGFYGTTHLQLTGDMPNATHIIGGSEDTYQYGSSYVTITEGDYSNAVSGKLPIIAAGNYNISETAASTVHYGDSYLHLAGGTYGAVYGGSYGTWTESATFNYSDGGSTIPTTVEGLTHVLIDGTAVVDTVYGGDFTSTETTHTGDVLIDIKGGTVKNVYAAGSPDGTNKNKLDGSATVNIYATDGELDASHFTEGGILYGGVPSLVSPRTLDNPTGDISSLNFRTADSLYDLRPLNIQWFNVYELADGAHVIVATDGFNTTNSLEVTGAGTVEVVGDSADKNTTPHDVALLNGATLWLNTSHYQSTAVSSTPSVIKVVEGTAVNTSYTLKDDDQNAMNIHLVMEGTGTNGEGALYKNTGAALAKGTSFPLITLTGDATMALNTGSSLYMVALTTDANGAALYEGTTLDLRNGTAGSEGYNARGYELTVNGGGDFGLYNTEILGGTLNVVEGTVQSNMSSNGGDTDLLLHAGATLELTNTDDGTGYFGDEPNSDTPAAYNGLAIESLSGSGTVELGNKGWLYINMDKGYTDFANGVDASGIESYAHFSGSIEASGGKVTKEGDGYQYFSGGTSLYSGGTSFMGGRLYALAGSTAAVFKKELNATIGVTEVDATLGGVFGTGDLTWEGGALYMTDGVNIYNNGSAVAGKDIIFGVESHRAEDGTVSYDVATYSGVLSGGGTADGHTSALVKEGGGTLILAQDGSFTGPVQVKEGSLNLRRWVDADDYSSITVDDGATLVLTYDNTGLDPNGVRNEITKANTPITISGKGDPRWLTLGAGTKTAALSSGIAAGKELELSGVIQDGATIGNVLHSGEGTLTLSGANTYSGGTTINGGELYNYGTVIVAHNTGLGSTAEGKHANLVMEEASNIIFDKEVETTLAAVKEGEYAGNDIRGTVALRSDATLNMTGNGYYATRTELDSGASLVFCGENAANWDGTANKEKPEGTVEMVGAGTLAGRAGATVAVSDAAGKGTKVYFQVTDTMPQTDSTTPTNGYAGDLVVEGDKTLLHVEGGQLDGGNYSVSGYGARLDAKRSLINVDSGRKIALRSLGDVDSNPQSTACLAAYRVEVETGGTLSSARAATEFSYNELGLADVMNSEAQANLQSYQASPEKNYHYLATYTEADGYEHIFDHNNAINQFTAVTLDTVGGLTMQSGSVYEVSGTNTGLAGTQLTLDTSGDGGRILLRGGTPFQEYIDMLAAAGTQATEETEQWVLFSDVGSFTAINSVASMTCAMQAGNPANQIFVARANEFVVAEDTNGDGAHEELADNILLVYDAGAQVVYLDRKPNIYTDAVPEPGSATLSLLALTALMARRRRK